MKAIAIIGTNGLPGRYGGWDQLMEHLTKNLSKKFEFIVYCSSVDLAVKSTNHNGARLVQIPLKANGWQSVPYDIISSIHAIFIADCILLLGGAGTIMFPVLRLFGKEVIYHPDGIEWRREKWSTLIQIFLKGLEKSGIRWCNKIISDNIEISKYIFETYKKSSFLIEYGGDHVLRKELNRLNYKQLGITKGSYAFKVCRIEPENNIDLILDSFINFDVQLIIVGNWNYSNYGRKSRKRYAKYKNILMLDPIYDQSKLDELRSNCGIYIHGHSVGGTNPSLVEAMSLGLNVLAYDVDFNRATTQDSALFFKNIDELKKLIFKFSENRGIYDEIGERLCEIACSRYIWSDITAKYDVLFSNSMGVME